MIRQPSRFADLHRWWLDAMAGREPARHDGLAECGWYRMRHVTGGPWVPVQVAVTRDIDPETNELEGPERLVAHIEGRTTDPAFLWDRLEPISRADFDALVQRIATDDTMAASRVAMDLSRTPTPPPRGSRL